ncbi:NIPA-like protein 2 [Neolecta irregularis DAH-3]|uniref:NIPA-like protein 2 n=1 Tax=Neolecta irregularis (strain DAH-3) TaxID=1198029 RepID=A0A1U7LSD0_NEOID|nr:NIPA-like protein 2 [Neolecta irregularis DAH-3]|eukprot:OLL25580.1 NIPA-like protein 2 [Neolecta irregularis DAH-3]
MGLSAGGAISLGITVGILTSAIQSLGLTLQRKSHVREETHSTRRKTWKRPMWRVGLATYVCANLAGSSVQITTLPVVILAPLHASGLIFNAMWASILLHESFTAISILGSILVTVGAALIAAFGVVSEPSHSLEELLAFLRRDPFIGWMSFQALLSVCILIGSRACAMTRSYKTSQGWKLLRGVLFGILSGILSAHGLLLSKAIVELLLKTFVEKQNQFNHWQSWFLLAIMISIALTQLYLLNRALRLCTTTILYPLMFCIYNITAMLDGLIYYSQASLLSTLQISLVIVGAFILFVGVFTLSWRLQREAASDPSTLILDLNESAEGTMGLLREMSTEEEQVWKLIEESDHDQDHDQIAHCEQTSLLRNSRKSLLKIDFSQIPFLKGWKTLILRKKY